MTDRITSAPVHGLEYLLAELEKDLWRRSAACAGVDPDLFYPGRGESVVAAKAVCAGCPVSVECLDYAIEHGETRGVWGGLSERARRDVRAARNRKAAA